MGVAATRTTLEAIHHVEEAVPGTDRPEGVVLRSLVNPDKLAHLGLSVVERRP